MDLHRLRKQVAARPLRDAHKLLAAMMLLLKSSRIPMRPHLVPALVPEHRARHFHVLSAYFIFGRMDFPLMTVNSIDLMILQMPPLSP